MVNCLASEMFCDASPVRKINDYVWEVIGGYAVRKDDVNDAMFGGNASAEGGDDETADGTIENKGIDVIMDQRLNEHAFQTKKEYQNYLKAYLKRFVVAEKMSNGEQYMNSIFFFGKLKIGFKLNP